jgi:hypothetical protein
METVPVSSLIAVSIFLLVLTGFVYRSELALLAPFAIAQIGVVILNVLAELQYDGKNSAYFVLGIKLSFILGVQLMMNLLDLVAYLFPIFCAVRYIHPTGMRRRTLISALVRFVPSRRYANDDNWNGPHWRRNLLNLFFLSFVLCTTRLGERHAYCSSSVPLFIDISEITLPCGDPGVGMNMSKFSTSEIEFLELISAWYGLHFM